MGKRGLYSTLSTKKINEKVNLTMNLLSYCDGQTSLLQIAENLNVPIWELYEVVDELKINDLINEVD